MDQSIQVVGGHDEAVALTDVAPAPHQQVPTQTVLQGSSQVLIEDRVQVVIISSCTKQEKKPSDVNRSVLFTAEATTGVSYVQKANVPGFLSSCEERRVLVWSTLLVLQVNNGTHYYVDFLDCNQVVCHSVSNISSQAIVYFLCFLLVVSFPELDRTNIWREEYCATKQGVERCGKECWDKGLEEKHGWVWGDGSQGNGSHRSPLKQFMTSSPRTRSKLYRSLGLILGDLCFIQAYNTSPFWLVVHQPFISPPPRTMHYVGGS